MTSPLPPRPPVSRSTNTTNVQVRDWFHKTKNDWDEANIREYAAEDVKKC